MKQAVLALMLSGFLATSFADASPKSNASMVSPSSTAVNAKNSSAPVTASEKFADTREDNLIIDKASGVAVLKKLTCTDGTACFAVNSASRKLLIAINKGVASDQAIKFIEEEAAPQFDFTLMTKYALGTNWKLANAEQQAKLTSLFRQLLIYTYSSALIKFKGANIAIVEASNPTSKTAIVVTKVLLPNSDNNQAVKVEYDLAKVNGGTTWKAYDVKIENASLVTTYRNQFNDIVQSSKIDGLIAQLQTKVSKLQRVKSE